MNVFRLSRPGAAALSILLAMLMAAVSGIAAAASAPEITSFEAATVDELIPGTELRFRVTGTPGAQARVRVPGLRQPIMLEETRYGVYEGSYTLKRGDRPNSDGAVRATLRRQNVSVNARLATPLSTAGAGSSAIQRFTMEPRTIEPGAELAFSLQGVPGGKATVDLEGTGRAVALTETRPGVYEGTYTVRRQDRFTASNVIGTLQANNRVVRTRLAGAPAQAASAPPVPVITTIEFISPADQAPIGTGPVEVRGRSAPNSSLNVHVNALSSLPIPSVMGGNRILLARQVRTDSRGNFAFAFDPRDDRQAGTRYEVTVDGVIAGEQKQSKLTLVQQ